MHQLDETLVLDCVHSNIPLELAMEMFFESRLITNRGFQRRATHPVVYVFYMEWGG